MDIMNIKDLTKEGNSLKDMVHYQDNAVVSKTILKNQSGGLTIFAFDGGQELSTHTAPFDAVVYIIEGRVRITIDKDIYEIKEGEILLMPAHIPHALKALEKYKMLLIMLKDPK